MGSPDTEFEKSAERRIGLLFLLLPTFILVYWSISCAALWWAYNITALIRGGYYERGQALNLVWKMALIITALTGLVWLLRLVWDRRALVARRSWTAAWQTALILCLYAAIILANIQFGNYSSPLPDRAFLPFVGHVNSYFFSEAGSLNFIFAVVPVNASVSGLLYLAQYRVRLLLSNPAM